MWDCIYQTADIPHTGSLARRIKATSSPSVPGFTSQPGCVQRSYFWATFAESRKEMLIPRPMENFSWVQMYIYYLLFHFIQNKYALNIFIRPSKVLWDFYAKKVVLRNIYYHLTLSSLKQHMFQQQKKWIACDIDGSLHRSFNDSILWHVSYSLPHNRTPHHQLKNHDARCR